MCSYRRGDRTSDVLISNLESRVLELLQRGVEVSRVPHDDGVQHKTERAQLVFLALPIRLAQFALFPVEECSGQVVALLGSVHLTKDSAPIRLVVDEAEHVERLRDPSVLGDGQAQGRRTPTGLQGLDQPGRAELAEQERPGSTEHGVPVVRDPVRADGGV